jgi:hypothetical protein
MCAMSPRLLRPREGGFVSPDADARAYLAAVRIADGSNLEPAVAKAISDFIIGCKSDGIWSAIKASCILMGARTLSGALTPLVGSAPTNNNFVSGDYDRETGLIGNSSTKYLNANRSNNADPQNSKHLSVYVTSVAETAATGRAFIGAAGTNAGRSALGVSANTTNTFAVVNSTASFPAGTVATGFFGATRSLSSEFVTRLGGSETTHTLPQAASGTPADKNTFVFARENNSGLAELYVDARMTFYSIGEHLDLSLLDTRVSALVTAIGAAI